MQPHITPSSVLHCTALYCTILCTVQVWCDWLLGNNDTWYPLVSSEPFAQLAQLATRLETVKTQVSGILDLCLSEKTFLAHPQGGSNSKYQSKIYEPPLHVKECH